MSQEKVGVVGRYRQSKEALVKFFAPLSSWNSPVRGVGYNPIAEGQALFQGNRGASYRIGFTEAVYTRREGNRRLTALRKSLAEIPGVFPLGSHQSWDAQKQEYRLGKSSFIFNSACIISIDFDGNLLLSLEMSGNDRKVLDQFAKHIEPLFKPRAITKTLPKVHALCMDQGEMSLQVIGETNAKIEPENYSVDVVSAYEHVISCLDNRTPCGRLVIIDGPPGTGKSFLIRAIIAATQSVSVIVPNTVLHSLSGPALLPVLMSDSWSRTSGDDKRSMTLVIEDGDRAIVDRKQGSLEALSEILNLSDGILGEMLDLRLIVTTNAKSNEMDLAITRPGRLCSHISVPELSAGQAELVYKRLTGDSPPKPITKETTLATVYRMACPDTWEPENKGAAKKVEGGNYL